MIRRLGVSALWFAATLFANEVAWSVGLAPRPLGLVLAVLVAGLVWLDPFRWIHAPTPSRRPLTIPTSVSKEPSLAPR
ncbi:MAG TPA: hypothetical protein VGJ71_06150 [Candidatus Limnocylindrales bacterium]|jgi:hypothetical protein